MNNNKKKIFIITGISLLVLIAIIIGGTYAWYSWNTSDNEVTKIAAGIGTATVTFDGGSNINANLKPVPDKSKGIVKTIKVKADTTGLLFNMYLDITSIDVDLKDESFRYEFYRGTNKVKEGNFSDSYLTSNTDTCSKNNTKHIVLLTGESISTVYADYTLYIWIDGENYENPSTMMNKTFSFKLHADGEGAVAKQPLGNAIEYITNLYTNASKIIVTNNSIDYNTAPSVSLMNDKFGGITDDLDEGNIRYYGANPNNYIYFNCSDYSNQTSSTCEIWRIIGLFEDGLKLIKNDSIGDYSWDNKTIATGADGSDNGKNDWTTARLMKLLNPSDYYEVDTNDNGLGQSLYYNGLSGKCYSGSANATVNCDFTNTGIKNDITRNMIIETTYYLGADGGAYPNLIYEAERGTTVYSGRPTVWKGKIALAYLSDYGYAADFSQCVKSLNDYNDTTCTSNNWMYEIFAKNYGGWLLNPVSSLSDYACNILSSGNFTIMNVDAEGAIFPVFSLSSDLEIESGDGSSSNPYKLSV